MHRAPTEYLIGSVEKRQPAAEVGSVVSVGSKITPVEIKAGKAGRLKSLHMFLREKVRSFGVRLNTDVPSLLDTEATLPSGETMSYRLLSLPLYLVGQTRRLCERHATS